MLDSAQPWPTTPLPASRLPSRVVPVLLDLHGPAPAEQENASAAEARTPFHCLCHALLQAAPAGAPHAARAANALMARGWTTPARLAAATAEEREAVLRAAGYTRCAGIAALRLGKMAALLEEAYEGDLLALRRQAAENPAALRRLLKRIPGIGDVAADIFIRDMQLTWTELYPYADRLALRAARRLRLGTDAGTVATLCPPTEFPRLVAALVRIETRDDYLTLTQRLAA